MPPVAAPTTNNVARCDALRWLNSSALKLPGARLWPLTSDGTSWVLHVPGWAKLPAADFDTLWERHPAQQAKIVLIGKELTCRRWSQMYGQSYKYSGQTAQAKNLSEDETGRELIACFHSICALVPPPTQRSAAEDVAGTKDQGDSRPMPRAPNAVLVNWYLDGSHYMGAHSDDETQLVHNAPIFRFVFT